MTTTVIITGVPGSGKTTLIKRLVDALKQEKVAVGGFYTEEVRSTTQTNDRIGFDIVDFSGGRGILARVDSNQRLPKVGKYGVHVREFEKIALREIQKKDQALLVLDEIGKMELLSQEFKKEVEKVIETLERKGNIRLIASVPVRGSFSVVERLKNLPDVRIFNVTKANRDDLFPEVLGKVREML